MALWKSLPRQKATDAPGQATFVVTLEAWMVAVVVTVGPALTAGQHRLCVAPSRAVWPHRKAMHAQEATAQWGHCFCQGSWQTQVQQWAMILEAVLHASDRAAAVLEALLSA